MLNLPEIRAIFELPRNLFLTRSGQSLRKIGVKTRGEEVSNIVQLRLTEPVQLDRDQLSILVDRHGMAGADNMINRAMEELAIVLARVEKRHNLRRVDEVRQGVRQLIGVAQQIGMTLLARVARDLLALSRQNDSAAYCAVMARLVRIGESSLVAVWKMQDMSV